MEYEWLAVSDFLRDNPGKLPEELGWGFHHGALRRLTPPNPSETLERFATIQPLDPEEIKKGWEAMDEMLKRKEQKKT